MNEGERVVLALLVGEGELGSATAWKEALGGLLPAPHEGVACRHEGVSGGASPPTLPAAFVVAAVAAIVPHLSDYKTFYENLCGLLQFCEHECLDGLFNVVCHWLTATATTSTSFRCWLYAYVNSVTNTMIALDARRWKQALLVAALQENDARLKSTILRLVDRRLGSLAGLVQSPGSCPSELMRLLLFYWTNADKLVHASTLCAAKAVALSHGAVAPSDELVALLRWGRLLKPLFFENFVADLLQLQALRLPSELELRVPEFVEEYSAKTATIRESVQCRLEAGHHLIDIAKRGKFKHVYHSTEQAADWTECWDPRNASVPANDAVLNYLRLDLAVLPAAAFAPVFAAFLTLTAPSLRAKEEDEQATAVEHKVVVQSLFSLLVVRTDTHSLQLILTALVELRIASLPIWRDKSELFAHIVEELSESAILETDATKKWVLEMALAQLVLECDAAIVQSHAAFLADRLPHDVCMLAYHRISITSPN